MTKFQGSGFSFQSLNQNIKVVVIHYLENKVGVVDFANVQELVMFTNLRAFVKSTTPTLFLR